MQIIYQQVVFFCTQISSAVVLAGRLQPTSDGLLPLAVSSADELMSVVDRDFCSFYLNLCDLEFSVTPAFLFVLSHMEKLYMVSFLVS